MKKSNRTIPAFLLAIMLLASTVVAQDSTSDTLTVESKGYGATREESVKDAIRNAAESSVGILISSNSLIENYITIKDQVLTSANAYVYRYEEKQSSFDPNSGMHSVVIKALIAKKLLLDNTTAKISSDLKVDMTAIEKAKFEMQQMKDRSNSAIMFLADFIQKKFRETFIVSVDSISLTNKDFQKMTADVKINYTISVNNYENFINEYIPLAERVSKFSNKPVSAKIDFEVKYTRFVDGPHWKKEEEGPSKRLSLLLLDPNAESYVKKEAKKSTGFDLLILGGASRGVSINKLPSKIIIEQNSMPLDILDGYKCGINYNTTLQISDQKVYLFDGNKDKKIVIIEN